MPIAASPRRIEASAAVSSKSTYYSRGCRDDADPVIVRIRDVNVIRGVDCQAFWKIQVGCRSSTAVAAGRRGICADVTGSSYCRNVLRRGLDRANTVIVRVGYVQVTRAIKRQPLGKIQWSLGGGAAI